MLPALSFFFAYMQDHLPVLPRGPLQTVVPHLHPVLWLSADLPPEGGGVALEPAATAVDVDPDPVAVKGSKRVFSHLSEEEDSFETLNETVL